VLVLPEDLRQQMRAHASECYPEEACGLIAGRGNAASLVCLVENELHSPVRFQMAPLSQLKAFLQMEEFEVELLGIFHSHPAGPDAPSRTDIAEFYYPGTATLILSPIPELDSTRVAHRSSKKPPDWQIKGFLIENDCFIPIELI
jgi:proteasome lid subunit RPN8/RPN11